MVPVEKARELNREEEEHIRLCSDAPGFTQAKRFLPERQMQNKEKEQNRQKSKVEIRRNKLRVKGLFGRYLCKMCPGSVTHRAGCHTHSYQIRPVRPAGILPPV